MPSQIKSASQCSNRQKIWTWLSSAFDYLGQNPTRNKPEVLMSVFRDYVSPTWRRFLAILTSPFGQILWSVVCCFMLFCSKHRHDWNFDETYNPLSPDLLVFNEGLGMSDTKVKIEYKNRILVVMMTVIPDSTTSLLCTYSSSVDLSRCS
jgi:hypothetical protein